MKAKPSLNPQHINRNNWYYENKKSIDLIHEVKNEDGKVIKTDQIRIPLFRLAETLKRCGYSIKKLK